MKTEIKKDISEVVKEYIKKKMVAKRIVKMKKITIANLISFYKNEKYKKVINTSLEINLVDISNNIQSDIYSIDEAIKVISIINDSIVELEDCGFSNIISVAFFESGIKDIVTIDIDNVDSRTVLSVVTENKIVSINSLIKYLINERIKLQNKINADTPIKSELLKSILSEI